MSIFSVKICTCKLYAFVNKKDNRWPISLTKCSYFTIAVIEVNKRHVVPSKLVKFYYEIIVCRPKIRCL